MPKKRGRFIPCRGGGTDTTYYTDFHAVDEDLTSIAAQGGCWTDHGLVGITERNALNNRSDAVVNVASRLIYLS